MHASNAADIVPAVLNVQQACKYIGVGHTTLYRLLHEGEFVALKLGRRTVIRVVELDAFLADLPHKRNPG